MDWQEVIKKVLPVIIPIVVGVLGTYGGTVVKQNQMEKVSGEAITLIVDAYRTSFDARLRLCKETKGKVCE